MSHAARIDFPSPLNRADWYQAKEPYLCAARRHSQAGQDDALRPPFWWRDEATGVLWPAMVQLLNGQQMTVDQISAVRAYLRQWMKAYAAALATEPVLFLQSEVDGCTSPEAINAWLRRAEALCIDPIAAERGTVTPRGSRSLER